MSSLLRRIAVFSARRRALVIGAWLVLLAGLVVGSHAAGTQYSSSAQVAGSDSQAANDIMGRSFCALADGAVSPIQSSIKYFRDEYLAHLTHGGYPFDPAASTLFSPARALP